MYHIIFKDKLPNTYMQSNLYYKKIRYIYLQKESNFYTSINNITDDTISKKLLNIKNNL